MAPDINNNNLNVFITCKKCSLTSHQPSSCELIKFCGLCFIIHVPNASWVFGQCADALTVSPKRTLFTRMKCRRDSSLFLSSGFDVSC